jgi:hypothetical protein
MILKEGSRNLIWQSTISDLAHQPAVCNPLTVMARTLTAVDRNLTVFPSVQAIKIGNPNAAIPGRQDGRNVVGVRQTLLGGNSDDSQVAKAVEAISCGYPHIAFTILKVGRNVEAGETVGLRKHIDPSLVQVQEAILHYDPKSAIAIPEQTVKLPATGQRIHLHLPANELSNSSPHGDQECAVVAFGQS